jgi:hypothetical protein
MELLGLDDISKIRDHLNPLIIRAKLRVYSHDCDICGTRPKC